MIKNWFQRHYITTTLLVLIVVGTIKNGLEGGSNVNHSLSIPKSSLSQKNNDVVIKESTTEKMVNQEVVEKPKELTKEEQLYANNIELNKRIYYIINIAESVSIHLYDEQYGIGNERTLDDQVRATELKDKRNDEYFEKLIKKDGIELAYANHWKTQIIADGFDSNRPYPSFHSDDVYKAYLSNSAYQKRLSEIRTQQLKE